MEPTLIAESLQGSTKVLWAYGVVHGPIVEPPWRSG